MSTKLDREQVTVFQVFCMIRPGIEPGWQQQSFLVHQNEIRVFFGSILNFENSMLPNEITKDHQYTSNYHNYHARQLDNNILTISLRKSVKQQRHSVYRGFKLWNCIPKDLSNTPYHTFIKYMNSSSFKQFSLLPGRIYIFVSFELCSICFLSTIGCMLWRCSLQFWCLCRFCTRSVVHLVFFFF